MTKDEIINCTDGQTLADILFLPKITEQLWIDYGDTCLMTWDRKHNRPMWSQLAVDFCCELKAALLTVKDGD